VRWREVAVGGGHGGGALGPQHVGLGDAASAQARVTWPDGARSGWLPLRLGGVTVLARDGSGGTEAATVGAASP
jgi:hypothetical protein